jgi:hypothetical protein
MTLKKKRRQNIGADKAMAYCSILFYLDIKLFIIEISDDDGRINSLLKKSRRIPFRLNKWSPTFYICHDNCYCAGSPLTVQFTV